MASATPANNPDGSTQQGPAGRDWKGLDDSSVISIRYAYLIGIGPSLEFRTLFCCERPNSVFA